MTLLAFAIGVVAGIAIAGWVVHRLRAQVRTLEAVARLLLTGHDPDLELVAWVKVLYSYLGDPPEREGQRMSAAEMDVVKRLKAGTR